MDANLALLRWVTGAGGPDELAGGSPLEDEELLRRVRDHGVAARAACRLARERPAWATPALVDAIEDLAQAAHRQVRAQVALVAELVAGCRDERDLVPVKGFGPYLVTGDDCAVRPSVDVDLLAADPDEAMSVLRRAGFTTGSKAPSAHELWNAARDGWKVELHRYLPCWSYAEGWSPGDLDPVSHPGTWTQSCAIVRRAITHDDVVAEAVRAITDGGWVRVPDVNMALVITSAHAFRDFMSLATLYNRRRPRVRLAAVADMLLLARQPRFRPVEFVRLARRLGAHDAVAWARELIELSTGSDPWPAAGPAGPDASDRVARHPRHLWGDFAAEVDLPLTDVYRAGLPLAAVVARLGCDEVRAGRTYGFGGAAGQPLRRVLVQEGTDAGLGLRVEVRGRTLRVLLRVRYGPGTGPGVERVRVELGTHAVEWDHDVAERTVVTRELLGSGSVRSSRPTADGPGFALPGLMTTGDVQVDGPEYTADLGLPLDELRAGGGGSPALPLAVGVGRLSSLGDMAAGLYVPLMVRL